MARVEQHTAQPPSRTARLDWDITQERWSATPALADLLGLPTHFNYGKAQCLALIRPDFREPLRLHLSDITDARAKQLARQGVHRQVERNRKFRGWPT
ncbi:MAG: hypothetical protein WCK08_04430 [Betaproteobacteria bacterium]